VPASDFTTAAPRERAAFRAAARTLTFWTSLLRKT